MRRFTVLALQVLALCFSTPAVAQGPSIIRDEEIERTLEGWMAPLLEAQNMDAESVNVILVQSPNINAFVTGGANIFIYTGLIERTDTPGEVIGVLAHELGHISGGHLIRGQEALKNASYESILGTLLGIGVALATGESGAAGAISAGANSMAQRRFLAHSRVEEASADQSALTTLERAQIDPQGFYSFMEKLESEELLPTDQQSEYVRSHPLTRNRLDAIQAGIDRSKVAGQGYKDKWVEDHARMKAKLIGYINPGHIEWQYDPRNQTIAANYARSIAAYRQDKIDLAVKLVDELIVQEPQNPYFYELKGQALVEYGRLSEGIDSYKSAHRLMKKKSPLIEAALGHALVEYAQKLPEAGKKKTLSDAILHFKTSLALEPNSPSTHRNIAIAYGRNGQENLAQLHLAEEAMLRREYQRATQFAKAQLPNFEENSREWLRLKDIIHFSSRAVEVKNKQ